ncbi:hypothetical protein DNH61_00190 [Paenibacillus sambharensis]|uniref:Uncharacterized protein n=1 Tax=Paenibacillus sambharensis TaxID=1803190 RepID=A0A2W1LRX3_9BACL|nr:hypothetical protein [Paenibacillus sambharensis]PZD97722.1 hypothetical protein DNH61_00190 [Paenibacillus sambharensis]
MEQKKRMHTPFYWKMFGFRRYKNAAGEQWLTHGSKPHRYLVRQVKGPGMPRWAKWTVTGVILLGIGTAGYQIGMNMLADRLMKELSEKVISKEEIEELRRDPAIMALLESELKEGNKGVLPVEAGHSTEAQGGITPDRSRSRDAEEAGSGGVRPVVADGVEATGTGKDGPKDNKSATAEPAASKKELTLLTKEEALQLLLKRFSIGELRGFMAMAEGGISDEEKETVKSSLKSKLSAEEYEALKLLALMEISK